MLICTFAAVNQKTKRHIASWLLLAVFVPMVVLSSVHIHETGETTDGHLTAMATWAHDCVLCQFLTLTMLTAAVMAVMVYVHVCKNSYVQPLYGFRAVCCGNIVTRGPPTM